MITRSRARQALSIVPNTTMATNNNDTTAASVAHSTSADPKMPKFSGKEGDLEIEAFLVIFERLFSSIPDDRKLLKIIAFLEGDAANSYAIDVLSDPNADWAKAKEKLNHRYGHSDIPPITAAARRRLQRSETVKQYYDDKYKILRRTNLTENHMADLLTEGLPNFYRQHFYGKRFTSTSEWLLTAQDIEADVSRRSTAPNRPAAHYVDSKPNHKFQFSNKKKDFNRKTLPICQICRKRGITANHWHRDCPNQSNIGNSNRQSSTTSQVPNTANTNNQITLNVTPKTQFNFINIDAKINGSPIKAFVDSGSSLSIISASLANKLNLKLIRNSSLVLHQVNGTTKTKGRTTVNMTIGQISAKLDLHVMENFQYPLLLGLDAGERFGLRIDLKSRTASMAINGPPKRFVALYLNTEEADQLNALLQKWFSLFSQDNNIGRITVAKHSIITTPHPPIQLRPYRRPQSDYDEIRTQIKDLLSKGLIRESTSPYAFPVTLAPKKDGTQRLCIDYRRLNAITIDDKMPMPRIQEVLDRLSDSKYFTTLDIAWGFWHIEMEIDSIEKTAFVTNEGHYEWMVMPFGLKNSPATFQRTIQKILGALLYRGTINYLDDIIIYTKTFEEHLQLLSEVFQVLSENSIKLKLSKCEFAKEKVTYLGHTISLNSVRPSPEKTSAIRDFPVPTNLKETQSFVGLAQYFRRFVKDFTQIAKPLTNLTRKNVAFSWGSEQQIAFNTLKRRLTEEPVLTLWNPKKQCILYTDASSVGIGATLMQIAEDGQEHVIEYFSKRLDKHQQNYSASELECLAVVEAIEHFECYLNQQFTVISDHSALQWLLTLKKPKGKLYRWSVRLSMFSFIIKHKAGKAQQHVDALSRIPAVLHLSIEELQKKQNSEDMTYVKNPVIRHNIITVKHRSMYKAVVPQQLRSKLMSEFHENYGHPGKNKTIKLITTYYWWPDIHKDIRQYVESCKTCQLAKYSHQPTPGVYKTPFTELDPLDLLAIDTIVMGIAAKKTRHKYIQVVVDHHSRYVWAFPTPNNSSATILTIITNLWRSGIKPKEVLTDNHKNFTDKRLTDFCQIHHIRHNFSTPYHPQTQGVVERVNGTLITGLRAALLDKPSRKWSTLLSEVAQKYNKMPHDITGFSPEFLLFGIDSSPTFSSPSIGVDEARLLAKQRSRLAAQKRKERHDLKHPAMQFTPGDRVLRIIPENHPKQNKVTQRWSGPYFIIKQISDVTYDISETLSDRPQRAHISQLKMFVPREQTQQAGESVTE